jgi:hypothetical protein
MRYVYCAFIDAMTQVIQLFLPDGWIDQSQGLQPGKLRAKILTHGTLRSCKNFM